MKTDGLRAGASTRNRFGSLRNVIEKVSGLPKESSQEPDERLVKLIVRFGRDIEVLEASSSVESDLFSFDLPVFDINFVSNETDWDSFANSCQVFVPLWNVFVGDSGAYIEHNDAAMTSNAKN